MSKKKTAPQPQASLQDQLNQLKKQMKSQPAQAAQTSSPKPAQAAQSPSPKAAPPKPEVKRQATQPPPQATTSNVVEKEISDAEMVEFFRAAGDAAPIADNGRIRSQTKAKPAATEAPLVKATREDEADFAAWVQKADTSAAQAEKEQEPPKRRAIEKQRVWLQDLSGEPAIERLRRFLRAAKERGESRVTVVYGPSRELRYAVELWLTQGAEGLVQRCESSPQPNAIAAVLFV